MSQLDFQFDDLPLVTQDGLNCGCLTGCATVEFDRYGYVSITDIALTGNRLAAAEEIKRSGVLVSKRVAITPDDHGFLYFTIRDQIEAVCKDAIEDKIKEAIDEMAEPAGSVDLREYA